VGRARVGALLIAALCAAGCAVGRVSADCDAWGVAIGAGALRCEKQAGAVVTIQGGSLSEQARSVLQGIRRLLPIGLRGRDR